MLEKRTLAVLGSGFMGQSLMRGLVDSKAIAAERIRAADTSEKAVEQAASHIGVTGALTNADAVDGADIVILAVKPQVLPEVIKELGQKLDKKKLVVSVAAGVTTETLLSSLPRGARVIRAMPNIAAAAGQAATAICAGGAANEEDVVMAKRIFDSMGETVAVDESAMDAVTGLSGSGPAYVFLFLEALIDAGVRCGLTRDVSKTLAVQTLYGAATMMKDSNGHPAEMKDRVTSPGGTTIAGLASMESDGLRAAVIKGVEAAYLRSKELGGK